MDEIGWLQGGCLIVAALAFAVYVYAFVVRAQWARRLHTLGLFFTAVGLTQLAQILRHGGEGERFSNALFAVVCFAAAAVVQSWAALRGRGPWMGEDRRAPRD